LPKTAFKFLVLTLAFPLTVISPSASAAIKVLPSKPAITAVSPAGSGDQISDLALNSNLLAIVGTVETGLTDLVTSPTLGGSDGFISTFDKTKKLVWNLRLGSSSDDIATAITKDREGFFWVVGATSKPVETATVSIDTSTINFDSVAAENPVAPQNTLNRLALWKIASDGKISQTFYNDVNGLIAPTSIMLTGSSLKIVGSFTQEGKTEQFSISASLAGVFTEIKLGKVLTPKLPAIETIKAGPNKITSGKVKKVLWQSGIGTAVLVEVKSENQVHLLSNMG